MDRDMLLGGDFNVCILPDLDKRGGTDEVQSEYAKNIQSFQEEYQLVDIWRIRHPNVKRFTRRERSVKGLVQSRLDFWLISQHLENAVKKTDIIPGRRSDHSLVRLELELLNVDRRGKGLWKFNSSLLKDENYLKTINELLQVCSEKYQNTQDKRLVWDTIKCEIRTETIRYAIMKSKRGKVIQKDLEDRLAKLEKELADHPDEDIYAEYKAVSLELDRLLSNKAVGAIMRSRAKWVEEGEKNTSYFLKLEHRNYKQKSIIKLCTNSGKEVTGRNDILNEEQAYYKKLYTEPIVNQSEISGLEGPFLNNPSIIKLSEEEKETCDMPLDMDECSNALKNLPNGKSPGCDGLQAEFYKVFWAGIKDFVYQSYMYSFEKGELSIYRSTKGSNNIDT